MTRLNTIASPAKRKKAKRVGRGIGSGLGKTCGRGHKGQRARSGGRRDGAFEGGQMPLHRRVPKRGFISRAALRSARVRISDIARLQRADAEFSEVSVAELKRRGIITKNVSRVRLFLTSDGIALSRSVQVSGANVSFSASARAAIVAAGGKIADAPDSRPAKKKQSAAANKTRAAKTVSDSVPAESSPAQTTAKESADKKPAKKAAAKTATKTAADSSPKKTSAAKTVADKKPAAEAAKKPAAKKAVKPAAKAAKKTAAKKAAKKSSDSGTKS